MDVSTVISSEKLYTVWKKPICDEFHVSLWRSQFNQGSKTLRRPNVEDLSKITMRIQHQNEVVPKSTSEWCIWGVWEWEHQNDTLMIDQNQDKKDYEMTTLEWCIVVSHAVSMHQNDQATTCLPYEITNDSWLIKRLELISEWDTK